MVQTKGRQRVLLQIESSVGGGVEDRGPGREEEVRGLDGIDGRVEMGHVVMGQGGGLVSLYRSGGWDVVWRRQIGSQRWDFQRFHIFRQRGNLRLTPTYSSTRHRHRLLFDDPQKDELFR